MKILTTTIEQASNCLKSRNISSEDLCKLCLSRAEHIKPLNAFVTLTKDLAENQAKQSDLRHTQKKSEGKLDGITFAIKDNFCTKGVKTTCGSFMLRDFVPPYNATVVQRMLDAGAILLGKCNLDEFAMGSGTVDSIHGPTRNIWGSDINYSVGGKAFTCNIGDWRIAGGSSGGCAVAVASGVCFGALGSDTGGSTRNPASYCGVVGFKPTYASVSRYGLIPLVNSMDVPGIITRTVGDAAEIYNIICGIDKKDSTTVDGIKKITLKPNFDCQKVRIGIPAEFYCDDISKEVLETCEYVINVFHESCVPLTSISLPHTELSIACYSVLNQCEVASNMCRYDGLRFGHRSDEMSSTNKLYAMTRSEGFNKIVRERILAGNYFLLQQNYDRYFEKARKIRRLICEDFRKAWENVDILLTPTTLSDAPLLKDYIKLTNREQCSIHDFCTQPVNMAGCPAITIPIKLSRKGLPLSIQLIAPNFQEQLLLNVASWLENRVSFPKLELLEF